MNCIIKLTQHYYNNITWNYFRAGEGKGEEEAGERAVGLVEPRQCTFILFL